MGENLKYFGVRFLSLGAVVVGTPQYSLSESPTLSSSENLEFKSLETYVTTLLGDIPIRHGIESFGRDGVNFVVTRESGTGALNDIYLHFRFTGLKLA